jgi:S1-C subfamily serine protease
MPMGSTAEPVPNATRWSLRNRSSRVAIALALLGVAGSAWVVRDSSTSGKTPAQTAASVKAAVDKAIVASEKKALARPALSALAFQRVVPSIVFIRTDEKAKDTAQDGLDSGSPPQETTPQETTPQDTTPSAGSDTTLAGPDSTDSPTDPGADSSTDSTTAADAGSSGDKQADEENGGLGTGVIINAEGAILTANHVVEGAKLIRVTFIDGSTSDATVISSQPDRDIAVLKADRNPEVVVPAVMGGGVRVGDEAFAIGHPLGLIDSMSSGVISGLNRSIPVADDQTLDGLIQFDTAVNPGNSGGPLLNRAGQVVGIVTALANPSEQGVFIGIGFAVPIGAAAGVAGAGPGGPPQ